MIDAADSHVTAAAKIDVAGQQIAAVYSKALLGATERAGNTSEILSQFDALIHQVLDKYPRFEAVLASDMVKPDEKQRVLDRVLGSQFSPTLVNFLKVVAAHGRLGALRAIHRDLHERSDELRGRIRVIVGTAAALSTEASKSLSKTLQTMLGGEPQIETKIDPDLLGGIVLRVGDVVYDGSVAFQLERIREKMLTRSVHEIQSRRDSFRHSGGN